MLCVRRRLHLSTDIRDVWFKDEGGKVRVRVVKVIVIVVVKVRGIKLVIAAVAVAITAVEM